MRYNINHALKLMWGSFIYPIGFLSGFKAPLHLRLPCPTVQLHHQIYPREY